MFLMLAYIYIISQVQAQYGTERDLRFGSSGITIEDLTEMCNSEDSIYNQRKSMYYIPRGSGVSDTLILFLNNNLYTSNSCHILVNCYRKHHEQILIIVVEYPDISAGLKNSILPCGVVDNKDENKQFGVLINHEFHSCNWTLSDATSNQVDVYVEIEKNFIELYLKGRRPISSYKITITTGRSVNRSESCNSTREVTCSIRNLRVCISNELLCDKHINCGVLHGNDEDYKLCTDLKIEYLWIVVLTGSTTVFLVCLTCFYSSRKRIIQYSDNFFIFNEDEDNKLIITPFVQAFSVANRNYLDELHASDRLPSKFKLKEPKQLTLEEGAFELHI